MTDSPLEAEVASETTTFEHFGRSWTVPTRRHHKHIRAIKAILRREGVADADDVAEVFLPSEEFDALLEMNVAEDDLREFVGKLQDCLGFGGDSGNSEPSSASS